MDKFHHNFVGLMPPDMMCNFAKMTNVKIYCIIKNVCDIILRYLFLSLLLNDFPVKCQEDKSRGRLAFIFWVTQFTLH